MPISSNPLSIGPASSAGLDLTDGPARIEIEIPDLAGATVGLNVNALQLAPPSTWVNHIPTPQTHWSLVLSGGGAKGAFQVGAMQQLYRLGYWPRAVSATSVGSINALGIAERSWDGLDKIQRTWLTLDATADAYAPEPWVEQVSRLETLNFNLLATVNGWETRNLTSIPESGELVNSLNRTIDGYADLATTGSLAAGLGLILMPMVSNLLLGPLALWGRFEIEDIANDIRSLNDILGRQAKGIFNFAPLRRLMESSVDARAIANGGMSIRLVTVSLDSQRVCAVSERGELFEYIWQPRQLKYGRKSLGFMRSGAIDSSALITAAIASATVPVVNTPINLDIYASGYRKHAGWMVDGGVRQVLPTDQALELLDAMPPAAGVRKGIIAIGAGAVNAQNPGVPELASPPFSLERDYGFMNIVSNSFFAVLDEVNADELARIQRLPEEISRLVIMPGMSVAGLTELDSGLIQILLAYGWMRAFDAVTASTRDFDDRAYSDYLWGPTEAIIMMRAACWRLEREARSFANEYLTELGRREPPEARIGFGGFGTPTEEHQERRAVILEDWERFKRELPTQEAFPIHTLVKQQRFSTEPGEDLIVRIRTLKLQIETAIARRVRMHGLDSLPSVHELSNTTVGNDNAFTDWSLEWERHGIAQRAYPPPYPTGAGLINPSDGKPRKFGRFTNPWAAQKRFAFTGNGRPWTLSVFGAPIHQLEFSQTAATNRPTPWSLRSPDYRIVRHEGHILKFAPVGSDQFIRLYKVWNSGTSNNLTTTRPPAMLPSGFGPPRNLGFIFAPDKPRPAGTVPLWTFFSPSRNDHLTTCDGARFGLEDSAGSAPRETIPPDYRLERLEGYIFPPEATPEEACSRLYRWVSFSRADHHTTSEEVWVPLINGQPVENKTNFMPPTP